MKLSEAERGYIMAAALLPQDDRDRAIALYRVALGCDASVSDDAVRKKIAALMRRQEALDLADEARAIAHQKRIEGVAEQAKAVFDKARALEDLDRAAIEETIASLRDPGVSGQAKAKLAGEAWKRTGRAPASEAVDPAEVRARQERISQLRAKEAGAVVPCQGKGAEGAAMIVPVAPAGGRK